MKKMLNNKNSPAPQRANRSRTPQDSRKRQMWAVAAGCLSAAAVGAAVLAALAGWMSSGGLPIWAVKWVGLGVGCLIAATAGFCCARLSRQNGFFLGLGCAGILFVSCLLCSLAVGERPDWWGAVKLFSMLLCGCIFGSIGVNVKRKG